MRTLVAVLFGVFSLSVHAKPWNAIDPGTSTRAEVIQKFGEPSRAITADAKEVLAYFGKQAIKGTQQTQFRVDPKSQLVERIDVFPGPVVDKEAVESAYGPACPQGSPLSGAPCYAKRLTDDFRTYFLYTKAGLAVFFNEDAKTVQSLIFQPAPKSTTEGSAQTAASASTPSTPSP
ncbi:MAG: hypothetical protein ACKVPX_01650 [Myxococcaceae bacterium]